MDIGRPSDIGSIEDTHHLVKVLLVMVTCAFFVTQSWIPVSALQALHVIVWPSAERAYAYGQNYFDVAHRTSYHPRIASWFYERALRTDSFFPLAHHQLARLAFLRGEYDVALMHINAEMVLPGGPKNPSSWYVRGLIRGFAGDYTGAIHDYKTYLRYDPKNWAAINDYAWVLLKSGDPETALLALDEGLSYHPTNPWLTSNRAVALAELGFLEAAKVESTKAHMLADSVGVEDWNKAYPGNDPAAGQAGLNHFKAAIERNIR
jgi:tetratricopeptide (TPR) repeat protein